MLVNLHVKNFAIIDEIDVDFGKHLNILTGETGAGKSILAGSLSMALGARVSPEMIGKNGDYAMVEVVFQIENEEILEQLRNMDIEPDQGQLVISRKVTQNRSINKINGESVSAGMIKKAAALCLDIHGQHEHQSLLKKDRHREIVDEYGGKDLAEKKAEVIRLFEEYHALRQQISQDSISPEERARQIDFLRYETQEIEEAALSPEEMESIEEHYRRVSHAGTIVEVLNGVHHLSSEEAATAVSHALRRLNEITEFDRTVEGFAGELLQIESLLSDFNRAVSEFMADFSFDGKERMELEKRLDCIHSLQAKYGSTYEDIMAHRSAAEEKLKQYENYENDCRERREKLAERTEELEKACKELTALRKKSAEELGQKISEALSDLNFAHVDFEIRITQRESVGREGKDEVEFLIATNPGEPRRSLGEIASGGELSRIMLAIKSVFADSDAIETLIFDEIDTGISGRTAQKVSEKLSLLGKRHQVICITHLAQIAAMADYHFVIEKIVEKEKSTTKIRPLSREEMEKELARILGGVEITPAVEQNAREMKEMADSLKQYSL